MNGAGFSLLQHRIFVEYISFIFPNTLLIMKLMLANLRILGLVLFALTSSQFANAQEAPRDPGYRAVVNPQELPMIVVEAGDGTSSDTARIQNEIDRASATRTDQPSGSTINGARVFFQDGIYRVRDIELRSDVYLRFGPNVGFLLADDRGRGAPSIFILNDGIENVSIVGESDENRLRIIGPDSVDPSVRLTYRAIRVHGVSNFEIRNIRVNNQFTRFSAMIMSPQGREVDGQRPTKGTVTNFTAIGTSGGFAAIQVHATGQTHFENIRTRGGVGLRFESDIHSRPGITDVLAENIQCFHGRAAVLFQPHVIRTHNRIKVDNIFSRGCGFATIIRAGFVSIRRGEHLGPPEFNQPGVFNNISISNVTAEYGGRNEAQLRTGAFRLIPPNMLPTVLPQDEFNLQFFRNSRTLVGTPIGLIQNEANYDVNIDTNTLRLRGFPAELQSPLIYDRDTPDRNNQWQELSRELGSRETAARRFFGTL